MKNAHFSKEGCDFSDFAGGRFGEQKSLQNGGKNDLQKTPREAPSEGYFWPFWRSPEDPRGPL